MWYHLELNLYIHNCNNCLLCTNISNIYLATAIEIFSLLAAYPVFLTEENYSVIYFCLRQDVIWKSVWLSKTFISHLSNFCTSLRKASPLRTYPFATLRQTPTNKTYTSVSFPKWPFPGGKQNGINLQTNCSSIIPYGNPEIRKVTDNLLNNNRGSMPFSCLYSVLKERVT